MKRALAALLLLATGAASAQAFRVSFTVHGHSEAMASDEKAVPSDNPPRITPDEDGTLVLVLGPSRLLMEEGDHRLVDFDAGVVRSLASDGKHYDEFPILGVADDCSAELHNRTMMGGGLRAAGLKGPEVRSCDPFELAVPVSLRDALEAARAAGPRPSDATPSLETVVSDALAAGRALDAGLAAFEESFVSGMGASTALAGHKDALAADPAFHTLVTSLDMSSKDACESSLKGLAGLDRAGLQKGWVLDVFMGNMRLALGQKDDGRALLLGALGHDARMVGVWSDLGGSYVNEWQIVDAWRCWSTALALSPDHPMLRHVRDREASLRKQGADFF